MYELGNDGLVRHLERVNELHTAVDVLDVFALYAVAARHMKPCALVRAPAAAVSVLANRVHSHARLKTLGEPTRRTPLPIERGYVTLVLGGVAREHFLVLHRSLEEALAGLARERAVMEAAYLVAADRTGAHGADHITGGASARDHLTAVESQVIGHADTTTAAAQHARRIIVAAVAAEQDKVCVLFVCF